MLFANNVVLVSETIDEAEAEIERWCEVLESRGLSLCRTKTRHGWKLAR